MHAVIFVFPNCVLTQFILKAFMFTYFTQFQFLIAIPSLTPKSQEKLKSFHPKKHLDLQTLYIIINCRIGFAEYFQKIKYNHFINLSRNRRSFVKLRAIFSKFINLSWSALPSYSNDLIGNFLKQRLPRFSGNFFHFKFCHSQGKSP